MTDVLDITTAADAELIIESLRQGTPPLGRLREFTVGRSVQIEQLTAGLSSDDEARVQLLQANYGAGKTHLLRLIREAALDEGYAVALVTVDSRSGVRFNRMDQVCGAIMRSIEVPGRNGLGVGQLFDQFLDVDELDVSPATRRRRRAITDDGRWTISRELRCEPLWIALRAWHLSRSERARDVVADYLSFSWEYKSRRTHLYEHLVMNLPFEVRDPRSDKAFYRDKTFSFDVAGHQPSWDALEDLQVLAKLSGLRGVVLLFDEFEDVIQNMNNIAYERQAFTNLLQLFNGRSFDGWAFFAVTPEFSQRCRDRLLEKGDYRFPIDRFDELERVRMTPVTKSQFLPLARRVRELHGEAYGWDAVDELDDAALTAIVAALFSRPSADQVRQAMVGLVQALDRACDG